MTAADWNESFAHAVAVTGSDERFMLLVNAWWEPLTFRLPTALRAERLSALVDTSRDQGATYILGPADEVVLAGRSLMFLRREGLASSGRPFT